jgi:predicted RND superfamily exporter protein
MGLLIGLGYPVHIMSSMIPIFLMPIAVVDSVHILSEFFDRYTREKGREKTIREVMGNLFTPMLYTSLTSAAGFASLSLTPIPPVQVFGVFVAVGIMMAWLCTILFVPAYVMMLKEKSLVNFGAAAKGHEDKPTILSRFLARSGRFTYTGAKGILLGVLVLGAVAIYGITRIEINDNPVKWFSKSHPIRIADIELNSHFGGTYMAYLVLEGVKQEVTKEYLGQLQERLAAVGEEWKQDEISGAGEVMSQVITMIEKKRNPPGPGPMGYSDPNVVVVGMNMYSHPSRMKYTQEKYLKDLGRWAKEQSETGSVEQLDAWEEVQYFLELEQENLKTFKRPEVLGWMEGLQKRMGEIETESGPLVGKTNAVTDVVKKVYQELIDGREENYRIPDSSAAVAECLMQFQGSHNPDDLWHLVTPDYQKANIWIQLTSGDNKDMNRVVAVVEEFIAENPAPVELKHGWAGLTYINVVWQDKMVSGMLQSFLGSFLVVFIMMSVLFRSPLWGLICMVPLTVTIALIYGVIGLVGKDYDMPVAVLSALTLGMAVDFAIHFLERARAAQRQTGSWKSSVGEMFGEPARAITRNVLVIAIGFTPLLAASLVPYKTVGVLLCAIMAVSGTITLLVLPALLRVGERVLFKAAGKQRK